MHIRLLIAVLFCSIICTAQKKSADLLVFNATIYTVDEKFSVAQAMVIKGGKILATGSTQELKNQICLRKHEFDAEGKYIYPGFIDAHAHFLGYGLGLQTVDLTGTKSWDEILVRLKTYAISHPSGWLIGRGWD